MNSNVISTEVLEKMAVIFLKAGYLKAIKYDASLPHKLPSSKISNTKEEKELNLLIEDFKISNGAYFPFVANQIKNILSWINLF